MTILYVGMLKRGTILRDLGKDWFVDWIARHQVVYNAKKTMLP